jgi:hypothetical protein
MLKNEFDEIFNEIFEREKILGNEQDVISNESKYRKFYYNLFGNLNYIHALDKAIDKYEKSPISQRKYILSETAGGFFERIKNPFYRQKEKKMNDVPHDVARGKKTPNYCSVCGFKLSEIYRFCPKCGNKNE